MIFGLSSVTGLRNLDIQRITMPHVTADVEALLSELAALVQMAKSSGHPAASFFDDLIDACVMECYFRDHMTQRDLLFLDELAPHVTNYDATASESKQREFLA